MTGPIFDSFATVPARWVCAAGQTVNGMILVGGAAGDIVPRPLPPYLTDVIRTICGVELIVKAKQTDVRVNGEP